MALAVTAAATAPTLKQAPDPYRAGSGTSALWPLGRAKLCCCSHTTNHLSPAVRVRRGAAHASELLQRWNATRATSNPRTRHPDPPPRASAGTKLVFQAHSKPLADCLERRAHCESKKIRTSPATTREYRSNGTCSSVIAATKASIADPPALRHPPQHSAPFVRRPGRPERNCG